MIADGAGFLAVARNDTSQATDYAPEFWRSGDGLSWTQVTLSSQSPFIPDQPDRYYYMVTRIIRTGTTLVAVGMRLLDDSSTGDAAMWFSADDATTWQRAPSGPGFSDASVMRVALGSSGFVAVGSDGYPGASTQNVGSRGAAVWTSPDGHAWVRESSEAAFAGAFMTSVIPAGRGFVASGTIHGVPGGPTPLPPIWTSPDGRSWHRVDPSASLDQADFLDVSPGPGGYLATGSVFNPTDGSSVGAAWWSSNGSTWTRTTSSPGSIAATLLDGGRLIAIGNQLENPLSSTFDVGAWTSVDGRSWQALPSVASFKDAAVMDAVSNDDRLVVIGANADQNALTAPGYVWVATKD